MISKPNDYIWLFAWLLLFLEPSIGWGQTDPTPLKWKLTTDQELLLKIDQTFTTQLVGATEDAKTTNSTTTWMNWQVVSVDENKIATIESSISRMVLKLDLPSGKFEIDTDNKEDTPGQAQLVGQSIRAVIGAAITHKMTESGKILDVQLSDEIQNIFESGAGRSGMAETLKNMAKNSTLEFPDRPLRIGDSWHLKSETKSPSGQMQLANTFTYAGTVTKGPKKKQYHKINVNIDLKFVEGTAPAGANIEITAQDTSGSLFFDATAGRLDHSNMKQDLRQRITTAGQTFQQHITQEIKMSFSEPK